MEKEIGALLLGFGFVLIVVLAFGNFYIWGATYYSVSDAPDFLVYEVSDTYMSMIEEDKGEVGGGNIQEGTSLTGNWLTETATFVKNLLTTDWLTTIQNFITSIANILPLDDGITRLTVVIVALFFLLVVVAIFMNRGKV